MLKKEQQQWIKQLNSLDYPTPFKLTNLQIIRDNAALLKKYLPNIDIYYAMKSACDAEIIHALDGLVAGYDIASQGEFEHLKSVGVAPSRMLYSNPVKVPKHIENTYEAGVRYYAFDSLDEIKKLAKYAPNSNVYLRIMVSDYGSKFPLSKKFGIDPLHAVAYADMAAEAGLNVVGLAFHVGSQSENPHTWERAFETCGQIIANLKKVDIEVEFLNIGGGFPATYTEKISSIAQIAGVINHSIARHIPNNVRVVAEPGRFISAEASVIVTSVIGREHRGSSEWLFLDMGVFQGLMEPLEISNWRYPVFTDYGKKAAGFSKHYALTGPTCDAYDTIGFDYLLPSTIKVGDRIYIGSAGAYTNVYESHFNGFSPPTKYFIN